MSRLDPGSPGFNKERIENEVIVPVDEDNFPLRVMNPLKRFRAICAAEAASQNDDALAAGFRDGVHTTWRAGRLPSLDCLCCPSADQLRELLKFFFRDHAIFIAVQQVEQCSGDLGVL